MVEPDRSTQLIVLSWALATGMVMGSCASTPPKADDPPAGTTESAPVVDVEPPPSVETRTEDAVEVVEAQEAPPPVEPAPIEAPSMDPQPEPESEDETIVMIDTGARDVTQQAATLAEAARAERARRQVAEPTGIVITDKNLSEYATGDLTTVTPSPAAEAAKESASEAQQKRAEEEAYWRDGAREIRQAWRDASDRIPELEAKVFELRQAFYREDDGFYRDGEIKPAWDRAIEQLEEAHLEVEARQQELTEFLEGGRAAGAMPGWLREGIELEPDQTAVVDETAEPGEPVIYQQEASDPP